MVRRASEREKKSGQIGRSEDVSHESEELHATLLLREQH